LVTLDEEFAAAARDLVTVAPFEALGKRKNLNIPITA
jgi:hypothetical protein